MESQLSKALQSNEASSKFGSESGPGVSSISKATTDGMDSSSVTKKLEEELKKRDALIEVCYTFQNCLQGYDDWLKHIENWKSLHKHWPEW